MLNMDASTLELAQAVANYIGNQLESGGGDFVLLPRDIAELALAFTKAAIESLQDTTCNVGKYLN